MRTYAIASPWLSLLAGAVLVACNPSENSNPVQDGEKPAVTGPMAAAEKVLYEEKLTPTATYAILQDGDGFFTQIEGHADLDAGILDALQQSVAGKSLVAGHRALQALKAYPIPTPDLLSELDRRAEAAALAAATAPVRTHGPMPEMEGPDMPNTAIGAPLSKKAGEPAWDWATEAAWFKGVVLANDRGSGDRKTYWDINVTIDDETSTYAQKANWGYNHFAVGMNASHVNNGRMQSWYEDCNYIFGKSCSGDWTGRKVYSLAPRHFIALDYVGTFFDYNRRFRVEGTRVHLGVRWHPL